MVRGERDLGGEKAEKKRWPPEMTPEHLDYFFERLKMALGEPGYEDRQERQRIKSKGT